MKAKAMNVQQEIRRLIRGALEQQGGTGGRRECQYCGKESFKGQREHYIKGRKSTAPGCDFESSDHCVVTVLRAALKELR